MYHPSLCIGCLYCLRKSQRFSKYNEIVETHIIFPHNNSDGTIEVENSEYNNAYILEKEEEEQRKHIL